MSERFSVGHSKHPRKAIRTHAQHFFIFVYLSGEATDFDDYTMNAIDRWREFE